MTSEKTVNRRRYSAAEKAAVVAGCEAPGASVANVAMQRGINANVVHRWRSLAREGQAPTPARTGEFLALPMPAATIAEPASADIRIELRKGPVTMSISWPANATADLAAWTRELLR